MTAQSRRPRAPHVRQGSVPHRLLSVASAAPCTRAELLERAERRGEFYYQSTVRSAVLSLVKAGLLAHPERNAYILTRAGEEALEEVSS